jgi:DNA-binding winged helix-turn-helix (wHTH) protein
MSPRYIHFGPFQVDQQRQEVLRSGKRLKLQGKVYQVLAALVEKEGDVVTREELRARLWPSDSQVNYDANVNTTVNKLRQALGDSSDKPLYVETVPRRGYCLMVRPMFSEIPLAVSDDTDESEREVERGADFKKSRLWISLGIIGLILAGMLIGAGIMKLLVFHS